MPDFEKAYQQMGQEKLIVLAVGMGEDTKKISKFAEKYGFTFPMVADPKLKLPTCTASKTFLLLT